MTHPRPSRSNGEPAGTPDLEYIKQAAEQYEALRADPAKTRHLEAVDLVLDDIEDDPGAARVRVVALTVAGQRVWKIPVRVGREDMSILWMPKPGTQNTPVILWIWDARYEP
jgi:hypothetical protein